MRGTGKILLVDDEEMIIDVAEQILEMLGYTVLTAKGGDEAIEIFNRDNQTIDLVILDLIMPNADGGHVYDVLKGIDPDVKVLLSSGYSIDGKASEIMARGCNGFIQKPFSVETISEKIKEIVG